MQNSFVYAGTYTEGQSEGIYLCQLDVATGQLARLRVAAHTANPSYLAIDPARRRLYAVNELSHYEGRPGGTVSAFDIEPSTAQLTLINRQFSHGAAPAYLTLHPSGRYLFVVNYTGGNVVVFPIGHDGALAEPSAIINHTGRSVHPKRQEAPHPHAIILDSQAKHAFVPDLGLDRIMQYRFDEHSGQLSPHQPPLTPSAPGSGPRHFVLHPDNKHAYVVNELSSTITAYLYDANRGTLQPAQTVSTLPQEYKGQNTAAALHLSPNGRVLYASNRGHDSIAVHAVDLDAGTLTPIQTASTLGRTPRDFAIDPSGALLLAANQDSHEIVTFRIDPDEGTLVPTGHTTPIPSPVCIKTMSPVDK